MIGNIYQLLPAMAGVLGVASVWADPGYLPNTGPVPLRFRVPPPPPAAVKQINDPFPPPFLPPFFPSPTLISLPMPPKPPHPPEVPKTSQLAAAPGAVTNGAALEFDAREPVTDPAQAMAPNALISPQMLLKFFRNSNHAGGSPGGRTSSMEAMAPLGFTPPQATAPPTPPPSSTATFSISP